MKIVFFPTFFLGNIGQENVFYDILERKNAFLSYKNKKFKKSKNWHFSSRVNPCFLSKNGHFFNFFFLGNIGQENIFYDILQRKKAFLSYKNKKFKANVIREWAGKPWPGWVADLSRHDPNEELVRSSLLDWHAWDKLEIQLSKNRWIILMISYLF